MAPVDLRAIERTEWLPFIARIPQVLWVKAFHIVFMVTWFAGLFYLPRLFVYHAMTDDEAGRQRFEVMERKLYYGIMAPGAVLTVVFGLWLWLGYGIGGAWLHAKSEMLDHRTGKTWKKGVAQFKSKEFRPGLGQYDWQAEEKG